MHDPGAVPGRDELVGEDRKQLFGRAVAGREDRSAVGAEARHELEAREALDDLSLLTEHVLHARLGKDVFLICKLRHGVRGAGRDRQRDVARQRPRRRRPHEQLLGAARDGELQEHALIDDVLVAERDLVRGQRRLAARAVGDDLLPLVEQAALVDLASAHQTDSM